MFYAEAQSFSLSGGIPDKHKRKYVYKNKIEIR